MAPRADSVAVIIAAHNAAATIRRAIASALAEPEVSACVVVDDASRDDTSAAALSADDGSGRLVVVAQPDNLGPAGARNLALSMIDADWICVLDSDDFMLHGRIARLLQASNGQDMVADDILIVPEGSEDKAESIFASTQDSPAGAQPNFELDLVQFVRGNISCPQRPRGELGFLKPLIRRSFLERHALRYDPALRLGEDYAFYVEALLAGARFKVVPPAGYVAIERQSSISSCHTATDIDCIVAFDERCLEHPRLSPGQKAAFHDHHASVLRNADFRRTLQRRVERGRMAAILYALGHMTSVPYMLRETLTAKLRTLRSRRTVDGTSQTRFLIGSVQRGASF